MRYHINIKPFFFTAIYGQTDPVDRDRAFFHNIPEKFFIGFYAEDDGIRLLGFFLDSPQPVDMAEDKVTA